MGSGGSPSPFLGRGGEDGAFKDFTSITEEEVARTLRPEGAGEEGEGLEDGGILKEPTILAFPRLASSSFLLLFCQAAEPGMREERKEEEDSFAAAHMTSAPTKRITKTQTHRAAQAIYYALFLLRRNQKAPPAPKRRMAEMESPRTHFPPVKGKEEGVITL